MSRTARNKKTDKLLLHLTTNAANAVEKARDTPAAKTAAIRNQELATFILQETKEAATVEDLIYLEMALQKYDFLTAQTAADQKSIKNARIDYKQLTDCIHQMRTDPEAYFFANQSSRETGGDFRKQPKSRGPQQISGNKARMQNRASFAPADQWAVWDARIQLASRTEAMLRTLHKALVENHERLLNAREQAVEEEKRK